MFSRNFRYSSPERIGPHVEHDLCRQRRAGLHAVTEVHATEVEGPVGRCPPGTTKRPEGPHVDDPRCVLTSGRDYRNTPARELTTLIGRALLRSGRTIVGSAARKARPRPVAPLPAPHSRR